MNEEVLLELIKQVKESSLEDPFKDNDMAFIQTRSPFSGYNTWALAKVNQDTGHQTILMIL